MAEKEQSKDLRDELPGDWELSEEDDSDHKGQKKKREFALGNNVLWGLFLLILVLFISVPLLINNQPSVDLQTTNVNGILIMTEGNYVTALKSLNELHIEGKRDETWDSNDALNEILVVIGQSAAPTGGGKYTLYAGLGDKTQIKFEGKNIEITGKDKREFWNAIWTLNSIVSDTDIHSDIDLYDVQNSFAGIDTVYLVQNMDNTCSPYSRVIASEGDILSSLGFKQSQYGFDIAHYQKEGGVCSSFTNLTEVVDCPQSADNVYVITMQRGDSNKISISGNEIVFEYFDCSSVNTISVILRDILFPNIVSSLSGVSFPTSTI